MSRQYRYARAAVAMLSLALAACGSSSSSKSASSTTVAAAATPTSSASATTPATTVAGPKPTVKVMVGGLSKQIYLAFTLTKQLGYFDEQGVNVELSDEPSGVNAEEAMLAGQVDAVGGFYDHTIDVQSKGKAIESVVQILKIPGEVELCRTDLQDQIKSPADFSGRNLGVTGLGSSTNFLTKALAVHAGVAADKVTSVAVQAGTTFIGARSTRPSTAA
jgi:NitT/TauT family transport system substrate-binding protein